MEKTECKVPKDCSDYHEIIECITSALDAKDPYTAHHSKRVSEMALVVCNLLGFKEVDAEQIHIASHLHDIGANILNNSVRISELKDIVLYHHERFDGKGYPKGLIGEYVLQHWGEVTQAFGVNEKEKHTRKTPKLNIY